MNQPQQPPVQQVADDEIDLRELFKVIWQGKWIIIATTFVFAVASVFYALRLPDIYKSEALLAPATEQQSAGLSGQLGGLAALAGVNIGTGSGVDKTALTIEILKSREFIGRFIQKHDLFVPIMAAKNWNRTEDKLIVRSDVYDTKTNQWLRKVKAPFTAKPSVLETYDVFMRLLSVTQDKTTGMVKLSMEHYSPYLAQQWVTWLVQEINDEMRQRELSEAQSSIDYLTEQISKTNISDVRTMLFSLIEEHTKTVMLANVRPEYVLQTVDPAVLAEKKSKPARALICVLGLILGCIMSVLVVLIHHFNKNL